MNHDDARSPSCSPTPPRLGVETGYWDVRGQLARGVGRRRSSPCSIGHGRADRRARRRGGVAAPPRARRATRGCWPRWSRSSATPRWRSSCACPRAPSRGRPGSRSRFEDGGARVSEVTARPTSRSSAASRPTAGGGCAAGSSCRPRCSVATGSRSATTRSRVELREQRHEATLLVAPDHVVQPGRRRAAVGRLRPGVLVAHRTGYRCRRDGPRRARRVDRRVRRQGRRHPAAAGRLPRRALRARARTRRCRRRFWNEVYLDVERLPELARSPAARARLDDPGTQAEIAALRGAPQFDAARQCRLVTALLDELTTTFFAQPVSERAEFDRWVADNPLVIEYGRFRAAVERAGRRVARVARRSSATACSLRRRLRPPGRRPPRLRPVVDAPPARRAVREPSTRGASGSTSTCRSGRAATGSTRGSTSDAYGWGAAVGRAARRLLRRRPELGLPAAAPRRGPRRGPPPAAPSACATT